ncbi:Protein AE7-like 1 [Glycine soja]|uniref:Protein AE7-like 1 n=1 Tax=Glycine soja TaxID=3848 RepID=A0A445M4H9_GLYSO|nr:Protein AE7-like 1 [Glycine soja]
MTLGLINANPVVHAKKERIARSDDPHADDAVDPLDIYDILFFFFSFSLLPLPTQLTVEILDLALTNFVRDIRDPEHPYSLEQLSVLSEESISVDDKLGRILITFTPTVQHCSMATVIGLCLRVKLKHYFPPHYKRSEAVPSHNRGRCRRVAVADQTTVIGDKIVLVRSHPTIRNSIFLVGHPAPLFGIDNYGWWCVDIKVSPGSHANEESVNKQLNDKERVAAALENPNLRQLVDECLYSNEL